ncbi:hypothetical protein Tco_0890445 [Tanacetum coccineum]|uniref:Uncharacterized protein n=1 Tax=Tanacetum coccineum TaxID=301880 RepID=A0ABQ5C3I6_9ASTR
MLSDAALLEECQLIKALRRSKRDTNIHQVGGSSEGADFESKVLDEPKGKSNDTSEGTGLKLVVLDVSKADSFESEYESWGDSGDEANVQDDEEVQESDDEPQHADDERIDSENQETNDDEEETEDELTDAEPDDEDKGDKEMTNAKSKDVEHANVIQESAGNLVKDDAQATPKTEGPITSSSISSDYAAKYLNFDNIPPVETEVVSMLDINVQHEVPRTSPLLTSCLPTPSTTVVSESKTLTVLQLRVTDLEKDVKGLIDVDNSTKVISTIQFKVLKAVKEYLGSSLDDAIHKVIQKNIADIIKEHSVPAETVERLGKQYAP